MATVIRGSDNFDTSDNATQTELDALVTGKVLQVVSVTKTDTFSTTAAFGSFTDITGLSASITPSSTSSKILITASLTNGSNQWATSYVVKRGGTIISTATGDQVGTTRPRITSSSTIYGANNDETNTSNMNYLDSPASTSSQTYQIAMGGRSSGTVTLNMSYADTDNNYFPRAISTLTLMEISG